MDNAILDRVERQAWFHRYPRGFPVGLLLLSLLITLVAAIAIEQSERASRTMRLESRGKDLAAALQRRATETVAYLVAGSAMFSEQGQVRPKMFSVYDFSRSTSLQGSGARGIGFAAWLRSDAVSQFERAQRSAWPAGRAVYPAPRGKFAAPVTLIEPHDPGNEAALGFDMYSEPIRRRAMDLARSSDEPAMTGIVHLAQDGFQANRNGFLIYVPVKVGREPDGQDLIGFVYAAFRAEAFLRSAAALAEESGIDYALYDQSVGPDRLLAGRSDLGSGQVSAIVPLTIAQRELKLVVAAKRVTGLSMLTQIVAAIGLIIGAVLMGAALYVTHRAADDRRVLEWLSEQSKIRNALARELNHRVKNTLANVLSIVSLTRRRSSTIEEFSEGLIGRLRALSATQDLLVQREWKDAPVRDIVHNELAPYLQSGDNHIRIVGPDVSIAPNDALSLGLAIHELATNAAKYGALSVPNGEIALDWTITPTQQIELNWQELGGPQVAKPTKRGFGTDLIERIVAHELQSDVTIDFRPEGVHCRLIVPLRERNQFAIRQPR